MSFVMPGQITKELLERRRGQRQCNLADLPKLAVCCWCNENVIKPPKRRYCSDTCKESAFMFCTPQHPQAKMFILTQLQDCTCPGCGEIFDDQLLERIDREWKHIQDMKKIGYWKDINEVSLWRLGQNTGHIWQVDHVVPIFRGGSGIGLENVQVLCVKCHTKKTIRERKSA